MSKIKGKGFVIMESYEPIEDYKIQSKIDFIQGNRYVAKKKFGGRYDPKTNYKEITDYDVEEGDIIIFDFATYWGEPHFIVEKSGKENVCVPHDKVDDYVETIADRRKRKIKNLWN